MADDPPRRRRPRLLSEEERELWGRVAASVEPLPRKRRPPKRAKPVVEEPPVTAVMPEAPPPSPPAAKAGKAAKAAVRPEGPPAPPPPPPLTPLDRRTTQKLGRGTLSVDGRIDLHGLTQDAARRRLMAFLAVAQGRGDKLVLVITGKGRGEAGADPLEPGRGVLRRVVPEWLALASLRPVVVGFSPARREHGGDGALYVRLRRPR